MTGMRGFALAWALALTLSACSQGPAVDEARIAAADSAPGEWLTHGRTYSEQRFSPLDQINTQNVSQLGVAWTYELRSPRGAEAIRAYVAGEARTLYEDEQGRAR